MARSMSQVRSIFSEFGFLSAAYGETVSQLTQWSNPDTSVSIESTFDLLIVNRFAALNTYAFHVVATARNTHSKAEDKLELALGLIKCVWCQYVRCDNLTGHNFMCDEISEHEFVSELNNEGFMEKAPSFDSGFLLSSGAVEKISSKEAASNHV